ncbi:PREDICTED: cytochrome b-c1 complex subunit 8-like [Chrysochloris asiatica]|uniref:Cytochrome b-c1 complex subunit 8 n=1 Tax=Chrysochloris asiatica TaxID=185453 RepID=A0A9B0WQB2_CHRAS|nr:PREDICTED: cytochrome b-c1 complex subunit 8-like [Chrysochloris asiatica]
MGHDFGNLRRMLHVITYVLLPFQQRAFLNYFSKGIPNMLCHTHTSVLRVVPLFYLVYTWGTRVFEKSKRKNPATYENDNSLGWFPISERPFSGRGVYPVS